MEKEHDTLVQEKVIRLRRDQLNEIIKALRRKLYDYNKQIREKNLYLRPYNEVFKKNEKKYYYTGYYWYEIVKNNGRSLLKYKGIQKPADLPTPPDIPKTRIRRNRGEYEISESDLERIEKFIGIKIIDEDQKQKRRN